MLTLSCGPSPQTASRVESSLYRASRAFSHSPLLPAFQNPKRKSMYYASCVRYQSASKQRGKPSE